MKYSHPRATSDLQLKTLSTRWTTRDSPPSILRGNVTRFAPQKALKLIAWCESTFDERVVVWRL